MYKYTQEAEFLKGEHLKFSKRAYQLQLLCVIYEYFNFSEGL